MARTSTTRVNSPPPQDYKSVLALARRHLTQLTGQRVSAIARAKHDLEEKYNPYQLTPEAKMEIEKEVETAMSPSQQKVRAQRTEVIVKSSKADARRRARHPRKERERLKRKAEIGGTVEAEIEEELEEEIEAGTNGICHAEATDQVKAEEVAVSEVLPVTAESSARELDLTSAPTAHVPERDLKSLSKDVEDVLKRTDDVSVARMMLKGLEILKNSREQTLPIRVASDIYSGASSDTEEASHDA